MNKIIIVHYEEDPKAIEAFEYKIEKLWNEHNNYTRQAIISIMGGLEDTDAIVERLMGNQADIGDSIAPYYGTVAATELTKLLSDHIAIAGDIFKAVRDNKRTNDLEASWQSNADDIATFLDSLDPDNWPKAGVSDLLKQHLDCTLQEATARYNKDWIADMTAYEAGCDIIYSIAQTFSQGVIDKFPESFVIQYSSKTINKKK